MPSPRIALFAEQGHFTAVHNLTFRVVMPQLSGSAWKVLCFLISETVGYNRRSELISYSAIKAGTGLRSSATISKALGELLADEPFGCPLIVRQLGAKCGAASHESGRYGLNLKCTVALQKSNRVRSSKNEARRISNSSPFEAPGGSENEAPYKEDAGDRYEESFEAHALGNTEDGRRECFAATESSGRTGGPEGLQSSEFRLPDSDSRLPSSHFLALCEVCKLDPEMLSPRRLLNARERAAQLASKYSPEQIRLAGSRWALPTAPHPDQLLDCLPALLARKERHDTPASSPQNRFERPCNDQQRNAAERRQFMGELARRFG